MKTKNMFAICILMFAILLPLETYHVSYFLISLAKLISAFQNGITYLERLKGKQFLKTIFFRQPNKAVNMRLLLTSSCQGVDCQMHLSDFAVGNGGHFAS